MRIFQSVKRLSRFKKLILGLVVLIILYTLVGFFVLPPVFERILQSNLAKNYDRPVTIDSVAVNPYALTVTVNGFKMEQKSGTGVFLSIKRLFLNLQAISLFRWAYIIKELKITEPHLNLIRKDNYHYNFSDLLQKKKSSGKSVGYSINNIQIANGSVYFQDRVKNEQAEIQDMDLGIPFISDLNYFEGIWVKPSFSAKINGSTFSFKGKSKPYASSRDTVMDVIIKELDISRILEYVPATLRIKVPSAKLTLDLSVDFSTSAKEGPSLIISGNMSLNGVKITGITGEPLLAFPKLDISVKEVRPFEKRIDLSKVVLQSPEIEMRREKNGTLNLASVIGKGKAVSSEAETRGAQGSGSASKFSVSIGKATIKDGHFSFSDHTTSRPFRTVWKSLECTVDHFSNAENSPSALSLSATSEYNETLKINSTLALPPLAVKGSLNLGNVSVTTYSPYYENYMGFYLAGGSGELSADFSFAPGEHQLQFENTSTSINSLQFRMNKESEEFLDVPSLTAKVNLIDLTNKRIAVHEVDSNAGTLILKRLKSGELNLQNLFAKKSSNEEPAPKGNGTPQKAWQISLNKGVLQNYTVKLEDQTKANPLAIEAKQVSLTVKDISPGAETKSKVNLAFHLGEKGTASADGTLNIQPFSADLKLRMESLDIAPLESYLPEVLHLRLTDGVVSAAGKLGVGSSSGNGLIFAYSGDFSIEKFRSTNTITKKTFVRWDSLKLGDIDFKNSPVEFRVSDVQLKHFYTPVRITPQGNLNIVEILRGQKATSESAAKTRKSASGNDPTTNGPTGKSSQQGKSAPKGEVSKQDKTRSSSVGFGKIHFEDGVIDFSDRHIQPGFQMRLLDVSGDVSGLVFDKTSMADVDLQARLEQSSPLKITGKINPLKPYVDLKLNFDNISMTQLNPYFRKYAGYNLEKGKLSLKLKYIIDKAKLNSQNNIVIDQLTFGSKVNSSSATNLPIKFALSLLQNREGIINLNISVNGDLNNPKFSVGSIITAEIRGLISKAVSSPFSFLASIVGSGGEELSYVEFDYGSPKIDQKAEKKLQNLALALYKRPNLELDIAGYVDPQKDREALKEDLLDKRLKRMKLREMVNHGVSISLDQVTLSPDEYRKYIEKAYAEQASKGKGKGGSNQLSMESMKKELLAGIKISDNDLQLLARSRALSVQNAILRAEEIDPRRIFILQPNTLAPPKQDHLKESRADMSLH